MRSLALLALVGCGLGGGKGGGAEELPVSGVGPYRKLTDFEFATVLEEPYVISEPALDLTDPCPVPLAGGVARVYYSRGGAEIWRSDVTTLTSTPGPPSQALAAAEPWEAGRVSAPSVVAHGAGFVMFYQGGDDGIGRADSPDGVTFTRAGRVLTTGRSPGALIVDDTWYLYVAREDGIHVALSTDEGRTFTEEAVPVLPGASDPHPTGGKTHIALFHTRRDATGLTAIGYAGSEDGFDFTALPTPILEPRAPAERAPGPLLAPTSGVLFFAQDRAGKLAIAAATAP